MTKTQKKVLELAKRMHEDGLSEWDLLMRGIPLTAAEALFRNGYLSRDGVSGINRIYRLRHQ